MGLSVDTFIDDLPSVCSRVINSNDVIQALKVALKSFPVNRTADLRIYRQRGKSHFARLIYPDPLPPWTKQLNYKIWHDLYFYFPSNSHRGEFCIRRVTRLGRSRFEALAGFHVFKTKQRFWPVRLDSALIEMATRVVVPTNPSNTPQNPVCKAWLISLFNKLRQVPFITGTRRLPGVTAKIIPVSLSGLNNIKDSVWMLGFIQKKPPSGYITSIRSRLVIIPDSFFAGDFYSFLISPNSQKPILLMRSVYEFSLPKNQNYSEVSIMEDIFRVHFLEAMALQLMYGDAKQRGGPLEFFNSLARHSFLPVALIKNGYLRPVKGKKNIQDAQQIVLNGLGIQ